MLLKFIFTAMLSLLFSQMVWAEQKPFDSNSLKKIESHYKDTPFLLVVWSIDCASCRKELKLLGDIYKQYTDMNLVVVATDDISQQKTLNSILDQSQLSSIDAWAFAESNIEKLRYHIDSEWFGEIPRSYFYDANHVRVGISGELKAEKILKWLKATGHTPS